MQHLIHKTPSNFDSLRRLRGVRSWRSEHAEEGLHMKVSPHRVGSDLQAGAEGTPPAPTAVLPAQGQQNESRCTTDPTQRAVIRSMRGLSILRAIRAAWPPWRADSRPEAAMWRLGLRLPPPTAGLRLSLWYAVGEGFRSPPLGVCSGPAATSPASRAIIKARLYGLAAFPHPHPHIYIYI